MPTHADPPPPMVYDPTGLQYQTEKHLGRGGFAICWQAQQLDDGHTPNKTVALKIVRSKMESTKVAQKFVTELQLHSKLHHPNIVEFYRAFSFQSSTYVVLEICPNGSLTDWLTKRSYLSMPEIRRCIIQTCGAIKYLHMRNIVHRDLKTGNLFLDHEMNVKVGDFGLAAMLVGPHDGAMRRTTLCGTPSYIAPEVLEKGGKGHNEKVDIWAIGIIAYTLAVGRAPFHASKPQQILLNVAKGEYAWPDLEKHKNDIPADLRTLVSAILVDENSRPSLDAIVSYDFIKLGHLPEHLDNTAIHSIPQWAVKPPTPATIKRGYTVAWYMQCRASGVGEYAPGKFFSSLEDTTSCSIYRDCEREAEAGRMPIVPIAHDAVYTPFVFMKGKRYYGGLESTKDRERCAVSTDLVESTVNTKYKIPDRVEAPPGKQQREELRGPVPPRFSRARPLLSSYAETAEIARRPALRLQKASRELFVPAAKSVETKSHTEAQSITLDQRSIRPSRARSTHPASGITSRNMAQAETVNPELVESMPTNSRNITRAEPGLSDAVQSARTSSRTSARLRNPATVGASEGQVTKQLSKSVAPPPSREFAAALKSKKLTASDDSLTNIHTDPATILARAEELRDNILTALSSSADASSIVHSCDPPADPLPFVSKWVDYSNKYGIGYVLSDGSVGIVLNQTDERPLTHTVVEEGYIRLTTNYSKSRLGTTPFRFFIQEDDGSLKEVTMDEVDPRQNCVLWAKFGRYMCKNLTSQTAIRAIELGSSATTIVRFYQRVGNVSIWGFSNGCFQFNFPDYTKVVLSADGKYISFTALPFPAIKHMSTCPTKFPSEFIKARKVLSGTIYQLLYSSLPTLDPASGSTIPTGEIGAITLAAANTLPAKLHFITQVMGHWISGGGLGCKLAGTWPEWEGKTLEDAWESKVNWVTVGRFGGDNIPGE